MPAEDVSLRAVLTSLKDIPLYIIDGNWVDVPDQWSRDIKTFGTEFDLQTRKGDYNDFRAIDATWTSSNKSIATVENGVIKVHKPGTVTITAKDAYGCTDSLKFIAYYLTKGNLTASSTVPSIGLQVGSRAEMHVYGSDPDEPLSPADLEYTLSREGILEVRDGILYGLSKGTVTVTATIKGDPSNRNASLKVTVIDPQIDGIALTAGDIQAGGTPVTPELEKPDSAMYFRVSKILNAAPGNETFLYLTGTDADLFNASVNEYDEIVLTMKDGQNYSTRKTYRISFVFDVCGETVTSNSANVKLIQSKYSAVVTPANRVLFLSDRTGRVKNLTFTVQLKADDGVCLEETGIQLNAAKTPLALRLAMGSAPVIKQVSDTSATVSIKITNPGYLDTNKVYKLVLDVLPAGNTADAKPATVTANILVK